MSNPWSQAYEDLRKPYLEGKMAKKDYDGDGKIESGKDEYMGSIDKAIKKGWVRRLPKNIIRKMLMVKSLSMRTQPLVL